MTETSLLHTAVRTEDEPPWHYQLCMRGGWGEVMRGAVLYLTRDEYRERCELLRQTRTGWLEPVPAPPGEETPEKARANRIARLRERQRALSDELAQVNRQLNAMGANDG